MSGLFPKIRYIEVFPDRITKEFFSVDEYNSFFKERFNIVCKRLDVFSPDSEYKYSDWVHHSYRLNKDGVPRKYNPASHLQTKECREKCNKKFKEFLEKRREEHRKRREHELMLDEEAYSKAVAVLLENKIDMNRIEIRKRRR